MNSSNREFLDAAWETGKRVARNVGEKACDMAEIARIRFRIAELKTAVNRKYRKLGRLAYEAMEEGELSMGVEMQKIYNEITELKQRISALKEEL